MELRQYLTCTDEKKIMRTSTVFLLSICSDLSTWYRISYWLLSYKLHGKNSTSQSSTLAGGAGRPTSAGGAGRPPRGFFTGLWETPLLFSSAAKVIMAKSLTAFCGAVCIPIVVPVLPLSLLLTPEWFDLLARRAIPTVYEALFVPFKYCCYVLSK